MGRSCQLNHKDNETIKIHLHSAWAISDDITPVGHEKQSADRQMAKNGQLKCDFRPLRGGRVCMGSRGGGKKKMREKS